MPENTIEQPGEFDALEKARPGELIFTLLERDPDAPAAIFHWCELRRKRAREIKDLEERKEELRQITEAEFIAIEMQERQKGQSEAEAKPKELYSGNVVETDERADATAKFRAFIAETDYLAHEAVSLLDKAEVDTPEAMATKVLAEGAHDLAMRVSPHRAEYLAERAKETG